MPVDPLEPPLPIPVVPPPLRSDPALERAPAHSLPGPDDALHAEASANQDRTNAERSRRIAPTPHSTPPSEPLSGNRRNVTLATWLRFSGDSAFAAIAIRSRARAREHSSGFYSRDRAREKIDDLLQDSSWCPNAPLRRASYRSSRRRGRAGDRCSATTTPSVRAGVTGWISSRLPREEHR